VKVRILPSSPDAGHLQHLISFVVDDHLAIDAGCIGLCGTAASQARLTSVLLTHSHLDHICSLPIFAMNVFDAAGRGVVVTAPHAVIDTLQQDLFNWRVWPDFTTVMQNGQPLVRFEPLDVRRPVTFGGLTATAIPLNHPVPAVGYLVEDARSAVLFAVDTGPTDEIWDVAARHPTLTTVFVDVAFPEELASLAEATGHLTPTLARNAVARLPASVRKVAVHLKAGYYDRISAELERLAVPNLVVGCPGHEYEC